MKPVDIETILYRARAIRRAVIKGVRELRIDPGNGVERHRLRDAVRVIETQGFTDSAIEVALSTIQACVERHLAPHFICVERVFDGYQDAEDGAVGDIVEVKVFALEADGLLELQSHVHDLIEMRLGVIDCLAAWQEAEGVLAAME